MDYHVGEMMRDCWACFDGLEFMWAEATERKAYARLKKERFDAIDMQLHKNDWCKPILFRMKEV